MDVVAPSTSAAHSDCGCGAGDSSPSGSGGDSGTPSDCLSPAVCKKLLSLSEDMNLLVRNITKEAKALVQAEM